MKIQSNVFLFLSHIDFFSQALTHINIKLDNLIEKNLNFTTNNSNFSF